jgi:chromosome segregation ATPase
MSVVNFSAAPSSDPETAGQIDAADARDRMAALKQQLEQAVAEIDALQSTLSSQQQLEQLLKQGRTHLQDMRNRLQQTVSERDALQTELADSRRTHQREIEQLQRQIDDVQAELQQASGERNRLANQVAEQEASHKQFAEERTDERNTFKRLLDEASSNQRDMMQELDEQRQQINMLREAAMRAQSFAREIKRHSRHTAADVDRARPRRQQLWRPRAHICRRQFGSKI